MAKGKRQPAKMPKAKRRAPVKATGVKPRARKPAASKPVPVMTPAPPVQADDSRALLLQALSSLEANVDPSKLPKVAVIKRRVEQLPDDGVSEQISTPLAFGVQIEGAALGEDKSREIVNKLLPDFPPNQRVLVMWFDHAKRDRLSADDLRRNQHSFELLPAKVKTSSRLESVTVFTDNPQLFRKCARDDKLFSLGMQKLKVKPRNTARDTALDALVNREQLTIEEACARLEALNPAWKIKQAQRDKPSMP